MSLEKPTLNQLINNLPQEGRVEWIGVRQKKRQPLTVICSVKVLENGLDNDHYAGRSGNRSITLIQKEHIDAVASLLHRDNIDPAELRRNIVVSGINLLALKDREFKIGTAVLKMTGLCHPCSRMEEVLGSGGYNALRGHGGINARVILAGVIQVNDRVKVL